MTEYYNHFGIIWILLILVQNGIGKTYFLLKSTDEENPMFLGETFSNSIIFGDYPIFTQYAHYAMEILNFGIVVLLFINFNWVCSLLYILNAYIGRFIFYALYTNQFFIGSLLISFENLCNSKFVYLFYIRLILVSVIFYKLFNIV